MGMPAGLELSPNEFTILDELIRHALSVLHPDDKETFFNENNFYASVLKIIGGTNLNSVRNQLYLKATALRNGKKHKISEKSFGNFCESLDKAFKQSSGNQLLDYRNLETLYNNFKSKIERRFKNEYFQLTQNEIQEENFQFLLTNYLSDRILRSEYNRSEPCFFLIFPKMPLENICLVYNVETKMLLICKTKYFEGMLDITYKDNESDFYLSFQFDCLRNILYDHTEYVGNLIAAGVDCPYSLDTMYLGPRKILFKRQPGKISKEFDYFAELNVSR